jgi:hypothetical protein
MYDLSKFEKAWESAWKESKITVEDFNALTDEIKNCDIGHCVLAMIHNNDNTKACVKECYFKTKKDK